MFIYYLFNYLLHAVHMHITQFKKITKQQKKTNQKILKEEINFRKAFII